MIFFDVDEGGGFPILIIHGLAGNHKARLDQIEPLKNKLYEAYLASSQR